LSNSVWTTTGLSTGTTLTPGQQLNFQVIFSPTSSGNASGNLQVSSSSTSSVLTMNLTGDGSTAQQHKVTLNWNPSGGVVVGYHVYRGTSSGGPYSLLTSNLDTGVSYVDSTVVSGTQYFYVATAVDSSGAESAYSNEASAIIPNP